ncbi:MFS general substrate transporter [Cystobasidium minutum MCA 4210]|uniref:MFS general substrate transporter n=1 Tax=Cystobasidium minutum MCA 4210 TaxID=1397322 RepID=UPI0034CE1A66|eukprot:jgi/Rhomi1/164880/fgenesh1_kg.1_\
MEASTSLSPHIGMHASKTSSLHATDNDEAMANSTRMTAAADDRSSTGTRKKMTVFKRITVAMKQRENRKLAACYWALAAAGWNDASLGPLIPYIENYFTINYTIAATMFIAQCVGYIVAGITMNRLTDTFGMGKVITAGAALQMLGYAVCIAPPPFPVLPCVYVFVGCGVALQDANANAWVAGLPNTHKKLGYLHGAYGLGGLLSPLVATAFVQAGIKWSFFFSVSLSFAFTNVCILYLTFWRDNAPMDHEQDRPDELAKSGSATLNNGDQAGRSSGIELDRLEGTSNAGAASQRVQHEEEREADLVTAGADGAPALVAEAAAAQRRTTSAKDKEIFGSKIVWICAFFLLLYVGAEVSIGGWVVSFLLDERDGPVSAGYVSSGFWGGITLGRVLLPSFNVWVGERNVVFLYIGLALALEFIIWFVKDLIGNAVAVSLVGFVLGPFFPIAISVAGKLLPRYLHTGAIGIIAATGSAGAAIFPFITGLLAQEFGTWVLQPVIVSLLVAMAALWVWIPTPPRRSD